MANLDDLYKGIRHYEAGGRPYAPKWDYKLTTWGYGTPYHKGTSPEYGTPGYDEAADAAMKEHAGNAYKFVNSRFPNLPEDVKLALTDLTYNSGTGWAGAGLGKALERGDLKDARRRFGQYVNAGGEELSGLAKRRQWGQTLWDGSPQLTAGGAATTANAPGAYVDPRNKPQSKGLLASILEKNKPAAKEAPPTNSADIGGLLKNVLGGDDLDFSKIMSTALGGGTENIAASSTDSASPLAFFGVPVTGADLSEVNSGGGEEQSRDQAPTGHYSARAEAMTPPKIDIQKVIQTLQRRRTLGI